MMAPSDTETSRLPSAVRPGRSALFVPATRPDRIPKALASGADAVIADLEDAVAPEAKEQARDALAAFALENPGAGILVRINAPDTAEFERDLALCARCEAITGIMVPKAERPEDLRRVVRDSEKPVWALVESARGVNRVADIARIPGVERLSFGALDLALDLDLLDGHAGAEAILDQARYAMVLQSRVAGLPAPLAGVCPAIKDSDAVTRAAERARAMGFGGMLCIHPAQIEPVHRAFAPTLEEMRMGPTRTGGRQRGQRRLPSGRPDGRCTGHRKGAPHTRARVLTPAAFRGGPAECATLPEKRSSRLYWNARRGSTPNANASHNLRDSRTPPCRRNRPVPVAPAQHEIARPEIRGTSRNHNRTNRAAAAGRRTHLDARAAPNRLSVPSGPRFVARR